MRQPTSCPRCGADVRPPDVHASAWRCPVHGQVPPLSLLTPVASPTLEGVRRRCRVPLWLPSPAPSGWKLTGLARVANDDGATLATAVACSGPGPLGGAAELVLVAEEPGIGLGSGYAAIEASDPGAAASGAPHAVVHAAGHLTPLWSLPTSGDRSAYVGEALGVWLWAVLWPASAELLLVEDLLLYDLRERVPAGVIFGPDSEHLRPGH